MADDNLIALTADIVSAHVSNNNVGVGDVPNLIRSVYAALGDTTKPAAEPEAQKQEPAVSVRSSVKPDYLVCLEDGKKLTMLRRYLRTKFDMTPEQYRAKWGLPKDYPMSAPNYSEKRRSFANTIGLGRKKVEEAAAPIVEKVKRGTKKAAAAVEAILPIELASPEQADAAPKRRGRPKKAAA